MGRGPQLKQIHSLALSGNPNEYIWPRLGTLFGRFGYGMLVADWQ